jgi:hypothetical protein
MTSQQKVDHKAPRYSEKRDNCDYFPDEPCYYPYSLMEIEGRYYLEYKHIDEMADILQKVPGQINQQSELGSILYSLMTQGTPKKWLEIGTWTGNGTTLCVLNGMAARDSTEGVEFWSYEADPDMYKIAKKNLENNPFYGTNFTLVKGRIPCAELFMKPHEVPASEKKLGNHYELYYEKEKILYETCAQVTPTFNPQVVILDGGEFSGMMDWKGVPKEELEYVILDDINCFKNRAVYKEILTTPHWELFKENHSERNGWAIFRNQTKFEGYVINV